MPWPAKFVPVLLALGTLPASAQLIPIRTVPVFQSHQFDLFPSLTMAMGRVSFAIDDSLLDPFTNPAKGSRIRTTRVFSSPGVYRVAEDAGAGRTLPFGALVKSGSWYGGLAVAAQGLDLGQRFGFETSISCPACASRGLDPWTADRRHGNKYAFALLGRTIPKAGISIGASVFWAGLNAIQGVDQLYSGSWRINQNGHAVDLRLAALKQWSDHRALTALVVHNRFGTTHDVLYLDPIWDPGTQAFSRRARIEENVERSRTWGLHLEYVHPIRAPGWRLGWIATTNLVSHPRFRR